MKLFRVPVRISKNVRSRNGYSFTCGKMKRSKPADYWLRKTDKERYLLKRFRPLACGRSGKSRYLGSVRMIRNEICSSCGLHS